MLKSMEAVAARNEFEKAWRALWDHIEGKNPDSETYNHLAADLDRAVKNWTDLVFLPQDSVRRDSD